MKKGARGALSSLGLLLLGGAFVPASCSYDRADRYLGEATAPQAACALGVVRCTLNVERCEDSPGGRHWVLVEDCEGQDQICNPRELRCTACLPGGTRCTQNQVVQCNDAGEVESVISECDPSSGRVACRSGACVDLCEEARRSRSNVGCEYWAVDLDNAMIDDTSNAAAQQFAVVVSNPQPDLVAHVVIEQDDAEPGSLTPQIQRVASAEIPPMSLRVFKLGPREVDGSPPGEYNTGTHTALTRAAYRVTSQVPVIAYQFNPLENVNVFSNDASLLKPVEAIPGTATLTPAYVVLGWPQTIASTEDPNTNFNPQNPTDLRAFVTIVGTRPDTQVRVHPKTRVLGAPGIPETRPGEALDLVLQPFDVLNLETDDFNADLTGSLIEATHPVVVFSGSEASDAPSFSTLAARRCCADHLEEQLDPIRTAGKRFIAPVAASRTRALDAAGASIGIISEPDFFRLIAVSPNGARVRTTLPGREEITLEGRGSFVELTAEAHFLVESDEPVMLGNVSPSQMAAGVPRGLPGGDPSFLIIPPIEQFRARYVFLTPDKYAFDFIRVIAPRGARVLFDGGDIEADPNCERSPGDGLSAAERGGEPAFYVHTCQLSFPVVNPALDAPDNLSEGRQNDGVHRIDSDRAVGVLVDGFDAFVSYAYAAGTELRDIAVF